MFTNNAFLRARSDFDYERFLSLVNPEKINETDLVGLAPLHMFVFFLEQAKDGEQDKIDRIRVIKQLLAWKADINQLDDAGKSPLYHAVENQDVDIIPCLLDNGADMRVKPGRYIKLPLVACVSEAGESCPMVKLLMLRGVKLDEFYNDVECIRPTKLMKRFYESIQQAREAITIFIGARKHGPLLKLIGKDCLILIAKQIYATRGDPVWIDR